MPRSGGFSVVITAQDKASAHIDALNKRIKAMSAPADRVRKSFDELAKSTGLRDVGREFQGLSRSSGKFLADISRAIPLASSLAGALTVAGAADIAKRYMSVGSNLYLTAKQAGVTVPQLQRVGYAASMAGGSADQAQDAVAGLNKNLQLLQHTGQGSGEFMNALTVLGVQPDSVMGKKTSDVLDTLLKKLAALKNPVEQKTLAQQLGLEAFLPLILQGTRALQHYLDVANRMPTLTKAQTQQALALQGSMRRLSFDVENTAMAIASQFAPAGMSAVDAIAAWIEKNQGLIESDVGDFIRKTSGDVRAFAADANSVAQALGGWNSVLHIMFDLMAARFAITFLTPFAKAALAVAKVTRALYAMWATATAATTAAEIATGADAAAAGGGTVLGLGGAAAVLGLGTLGLGLPLLGMTYAASFAPKISNKEETARGNHMIAYLQKKYHLNRAAAAGIVGNLEQESDLNPHPPQTAANRGHAGLAQWDAARQARFNAWARKNGRPLLPQADVNEQLDFIMYDLKHGDIGSRAAGRALSTVHDTMAGAGAASDFFQLGYERPGHDEMEKMRREPRATYLFNHPGAPASAPAVHLNHGGASTPVKHTVHGKADVHVHLHGAPAGTRTSATAHGDLFVGPPKVVKAMPSSGLIYPTTPQIQSDVGAIVHGALRAKSEMAHEPVP